MKKKFIKILCFDIDNTISKTSGKRYNLAIPNKSAIKEINRLFDKGYMIKLFTSRYMGRNNDSISKAKTRLQNDTKSIKKMELKISQVNFW